MKHNWKNFLTNTDIIPTDKPLFPLRFLFVFALIASGIFYRFVYIYLYSTPLSTILYDYKISRTSQIYIEGFFITAWIIFITVALFRISEILYDKIIAPLFKFIYFILIEFLFILDKTTEKIYNKYISNKKTVAHKTSYDKINKVKKHKK